MINIFRSLWSKIDLVLCGVVILLGMAFVVLSPHSIKRNNSFLKIFKSDSDKPSLIDSKPKFSKHDKQNSGPPTQDGDKMDFYEVFVGEYVQLSTHLTEQEVVETEDGMEFGASEPLTMMGYLVDMDDDFYFLGDEDGDIEEAVKRSEVWRIQIIDPEELIQKALENIPVPDDKDQIN